MVHPSKGVTCSVRRLSDGFSGNEFDKTQRKQTMAVLHAWVVVMGSTKHQRTLMASSVDIFPQFVLCL